LSSISPFDFYPRFSGLVGFAPFFVLKILLEMNKMMDEMAERSLLVNNLGIRVSSCHGVVIAG